jgi:glycyl-tRNA synthetase beta chain
LLTKALAEQGLEIDGLKTWSTARRLAVTVQIQERQEDTREELLGPPASVAFDSDGNPTRAAEGFAKRYGLGLDAISRKETERGEYLAVTVETVGQETLALLPEILTHALSKLQWPKSMRWGSHAQAFIRPVQWIVALFGGEVIELQFADVPSGRTTRGHRFLAPTPFEVTDAASWVEGLRAAKVEPEADVRRERIRTGAERLAATVDGVAQIDDKLLTEVSGLAEWPTPGLGAFEERYLEVPDCVLTTSMKSHQKYFPVVNGDGALLPHFVVVMEGESSEPAVVLQGNGRVLRARLADAAFFYDQDQKRTLDHFVGKLAERRFLEGLGTMADKAQRLSTLSGKMAALLAPGDADTAELATRAGLLAKADLSTDMVNEFASLQGLMGQIYGAIAGEPEAVSSAMAEHYQPRFAGDALPSSIVSASVALADRFDSIVGCFALGLEPTGSADPYALRRQALGITRLLETFRPAPSLSEALEQVREVYGDALSRPWEETSAAIQAFFRGRMKSSLGDEFATDLAEAVLAVGHDEPADVRGRLVALSTLKARPEWTELAVAVKRVANIASEHTPSAMERSTFTEAAALDLYDAWAAVRTEANAALDERRYDEAVEGLMTLKPSVDAFFEAVMVMSEDPDERSRRLDLVSHIHELFSRVAHFDRIST